MSCLRMPDTNTSVAVSYTHLDVYKRQADGHSCLVRQARPGLRLTCMGFMWIQFGGLDLHPVQRGDSRPSAAKAPVTPS